MLRVAGVVFDPEAQTRREARRPHGTDHQVTHQRGVDPGDRGNQGTVPFLRSLAGVAQVEHEKGYRGRRLGATPGTRLGSSHWNHYSYGITFKCDPSD